MESSMALFLDGWMTRELLPSLGVRSMWRRSEKEEATLFIELQLMAATRWQHIYDFLSTWTAWSSRKATYLLGLLAMIKCSICSYQCDN